MLLLNRPVVQVYQLCGAVTQFGQRLFGCRHSRRVGDEVLSGIDKHQTIANGAGSGLQERQIGLGKSEQSRHVVDRDHFGQLGQVEVALLQCQAGASLERDGGDAVETGGQPLQQLVAVVALGTWTEETVDHSTGRVRGGFVERQHEGPAQILVGRIAPRTLSGIFVDLRHMVRVHHQTGLLPKFLRPVFEPRVWLVVEKRTTLEHQYLFFPDQLVVQLTSLRVATEPGKQQPIGVRLASVTSCLLEIID